MIKTQFQRFGIDGGSVDEYLSEKEVALLRAICKSGHDENSPGTIRTVNYTNSNPSIEGPS